MYYNQHYGRRNEIMSELIPRRSEAALQKWTPGGRELVRRPSKERIKKGEETVQDIADRQFVTNQLFGNPESISNFLVAATHKDLDKVGNESYFPIVVLDLSGRGETAGLNRETVRDGKGVVTGVVSTEYFLRNLHSRDSEDPNWGPKKAAEVLAQSMPGKDRPRYVEKNIFSDICVTLSEPHPVDTDKNVPPSFHRIKDALEVILGRDDDNSLDVTEKERIVNECGVYKITAEASLAEMIAHMKDISTEETPQVENEGARMKLFRLKASFDNEISQPKADALVLAMRAVLNGNHMLGEPRSVIITGAHNVKPDILEKMFETCEDKQVKLLASHPKVTEETLKIVGREKSGVALLRAGNGLDAQKASEAFLKDKTWEEGSKSNTIGGNDPTSKEQISVTANLQERSRISANDIAGLHDNEVLYAIQGHARQEHYHLSFPDEATRSHLRVLQEEKLAAEANRTLLVNKVWPVAAKTIEKASEVTEIIINRSGLAKRWEQRMGHGEVVSFTKDANTDSEKDN